MQKQLSVTVRPLLKAMAIPSIIAGIVMGAFVTPSISHAETIVVPIGQQGQARGEVKRPRSGMKQAQVESEFGRPLSSTDPVGTPPISSWTYADFIVYFEYDHVVHSVLKPTPTDTTSTNVETTTGTTTGTTAEATTETTTETTTKTTAE